MSSLVIPFRNGRRTSVSRSGSSATRSFSWQTIAVISMLAFSTACSPRPTTAPSTDALGKALDPLFERWNREDSPGTAMMITQHGKLLYRRAVGVASLDSSEPITPEETLFDIASLSKHMTAYAVLRLVERGELSLDDEVRQHLPWFPGFGTPVTLRQLMQHTAGLREYLALVNWQVAKDRTATQADVRTWLAKQRGLNFDPGEQHQYSNTGYIVLAEVVAAVSGLSFGEFMEEEIFRPLGMERTRIQTGHVGNGAAVPYVPKEARLGSSRFMPAPASARTWGDSGVYTTADELTTWFEHLAAVATWPGAYATLLERGSTTAGAPFDYAGGLRPQTLHGMDAYWHGGSSMGFQSWAGFVPDLGLTVVLLSNSYPGVGGLGPKVLEVLAGHLSVDAPETPSTAAVDNLEKWVGAFAEEAFHARLSLEDGGLVYRSPGRTSLARAQVDRLWVGERSLDAEVDADGKLQALSFHYGAQKVTMRRYGPVDPGSIDWASLAGDYRSEELEATLEIRPDGETLEVRLPVRTDRYLPAQKDRFYLEAGRASSIVFSRDADGNIDGLVLNLIRARRLWFERVSP